MKLKTGFWVVAADGSRALVMVNEGTAMEPRLKLVRRRDLDNPRTHEQGRERPGRTYEAVSERRSAVETPDLHERAEAEFLVSVAKELESDAAAGAFEGVVISAPPTALGVLRKACGPALEKRIALWLDKDLTKHRPEEIVTTVTAAFEA